MAIAIKPSHEGSPFPVRIPSISDIATDAGVAVDGTKQKLIEAKTLTEAIYQQCLFTSALERLTRATPSQLQEMHFVRSQTNEKLQGFAFTLPVSERRTDKGVYEFYVLSLVGSSRTWFAVNHAPTDGSYLAATIDAKGNPKLVSPDAHKSPEKHHLSVLPIVPTAVLPSHYRVTVHQLLHETDNPHPHEHKEPDQPEIASYHLPLGYKIRRAVGSQIAELRQMAHRAVNNPLKWALYDSSLAQRSQQKHSFTPSITNAYTLPVERPSQQKEKELPIPDERTQALLDMFTSYDPRQLAYTLEEHITGVPYVWFEFLSGGKQHRIAIYEDTTEHMVIDADGRKTFLSRPKDATGEYTQLLFTVRQAVINGRAANILDVHYPTSVIDKPVTPKPVPQPAQEPPLQVASLLDDDVMQKLERRSWNQPPPLLPKVLPAAPQSTQTHKVTPLRQAPTYPTGVRAAEDLLDTRGTEALRKLGNNLPVYASGVNDRVRVLDFPITQPPLPSLLIPRTPLAPTFFRQIAAAYTLPLESTVIHHRNRTLADITGQYASGGGQRTYKRKSI